MWGAWLRGRVTDQFTYHDFNQRHLNEDCSRSENLGTNTWTLLMLDLVWELSNWFKIMIQNQDDWVQFRFGDRNLVNQRNDASKWNANKNIIIYITYIIQKRVLWAEFQNLSQIIFSVWISIGANEIRKNHFA